MKKRGRLPIRKRAKYLLEEFVSKGFLTQALLLAAVALALTLLFGVIAYKMGQPNYTEGYWISLMHMLDQGAISADEAGSDAFFVFMLFVTIVGMALTSTIIALISTGMENKLNELRKGRSAIIKNDHVLLMGYDASTCTICRELLEDAHKNGEHICLVVADDLPRETMEQGVKEAQVRPHRKWTQSLRHWKQNQKIKVLIRSGDLTKDNTFMICSAENASTIFIQRENDAESIHILLALMSYLKKNRISPDTMPMIVVLIHEKRNMAAARAAAGLCNEGDAAALLAHKIRILNDQDILAQLFAQACVHQGLPCVMDGLFNTRDSSIHIERESRKRASEQSAFVGKNLRQIADLVSNSIPLGFARTVDGKPPMILLNPPQEECYRSGDRLIYLSDTRELCFDRPEELQPLGTAVSHTREHAKARQNFLIIGWSPALPDMSRQVRCYRSEAPAVKLIATEGSVPQEYREPYHCIDCPDSLCWDHVEKILQEHPDWFEGPVAQRLTNIVLLSRYDEGKKQTDEKMMVLLLNLRNYLQSRQITDICLTSEILLPQNQELLQGNNPNDDVIASEISDRMMAQILNDPRKFSVITGLLQADNGALLLNPLSDYVDTAKPFNFEGIFRISAERKTEIPLGWIRFGSGQTEDMDESERNGLILNPSPKERNERREGGDYSGYRLVVFAGDSGIIAG